jgi:hypothetical protein
MDAGSQWHPSNSADGFFMEEICVRCVHDKAFREGEGDSCEIAAAMYRDQGAPEWIIGLDGMPFCKKFKREDASYRCSVTPDLF